MESRTRRLGGKSYNYGLNNDYNTRADITGPEVKLNLGNTKRNSVGIRDDESLMCATPPEPQYDLS